MEAKMEITGSDVKPASNDFLAWRFTRALVRSQRGRAFLLYQLADAEVSDEGLVFDRLLGSVNDPALAKMVQKHRDDEQHHNRILLERAAATGIAPMEIPSELRIVGRLDRLLGGLAEAFLSGSVGVAEACALLVVLEERAVREFPRLVACLREVDPAAGDVLARVLADERRHVLYANAVGRKYSANEAEFGALVARYRVAEDRAFLEHGVATTRYALDNDLLDMSFVERAAWRAFTRLSELGLRWGRSVTKGTSDGGSVPQSTAAAA
jgi:hypothetical protein